MKIVPNLKLNLVFFMVVCAADFTVCDLAVKLKNKGGDVVKELIRANTTHDFVTLEFEKSDGTSIYQFIDFKTEIQIFRAIILGEEERGQNQYQVMCFISRFIRNEFVSSDAMSKLRQKNPDANRNPEEDKGQEVYNQDLRVDLDKASVISPYIYSECKDAKDSIYARDSDLKLLSKSNTKDYYTLASATKKASTNKQPRCNEVHDLVNLPCVCHYEICIGWYPCGLKYCKGKDSSGKTVSYRCGIKTCRKCRLFEYYVKAKQQCLWDETV